MRYDGNERQQQWKKTNQSANQSETPVICYKEAAKPDNFASELEIVLNPGLGNPRIFVTCNFIGIHVDQVNLDANILTRVIVHSTTDIKLFATTNVAIIQIYPRGPESEFPCTVSADNVGSNEFSAAVGEMLAGQEITELPVSAIESMIFAVVTRPGGLERLDPARDTPGRAGEVQAECPLVINTVKRSTGGYTTYLSKHNF